MEAPEISGELVKLVYALVGEKRAKTIFWVCMGGFMVWLSYVTAKNVIAWIDLLSNYVGNGESGDFAIVAVITVGLVFSVVVVGACFVLAMLARSLLELWERRAVNELRAQIEDLQAAIAELREPSIAEGEDNG